MNDTIIIPPNTDDQLRRSRAADYLSPRLPPDILEDASKRLGFISIFITIVSFTIFAITEIAHFTNVIREIGNIRTLKYLLFSLLWCLSITLFLLSRNKRLRPQFLLDLGLIYEICIAACFSCLINYRLDWTLDPRLLKDVPIGIIIIVFAVIVPNSFGRTLTAGVAAALTDPLMIVLFSAPENVMGPPPIVLLIRFVPHLMSVVLALFITRIIYGFGAKLSDAREMGSYELQTLLGRGGMGEVWSAHHKMLARPAAVKLIKPENIDKNNRQTGDLILHRFELEAQATATLRSPNTIEVYDFGITRDGTFYYVMELLNGFDLDKLVREYGPQPPERVVYLLRQACHSLYEAHCSGLVHRDIKPANLFTCKYGTDVDFLKILDFGLVTGWQHPDGNKRPISGREIITGTPAFISPEMAVGDEQLDGRTDIYALGCVAYWLLTGKYIFEAGTMAAMVKAHIGETPKKPSEQIGAKIPDELENVVMKCLEKDPNDRPQSAHEVSEMLADLHIEATWTDEQQRQWWKDHWPPAPPIRGGGVY